MRKSNNKRHRHWRNRRLPAGDGFTLIELILVIVALGIIAAIGVPKIGGFVNDSRKNASKTEMAELKRAIVGSPSVTAGNALIDRGFEGDVGWAPTRLEDLASKPDSVPGWDRIQRYGWHGPYIDSSNGDYLLDAWGAPYVYDPDARTITSNGSGQNITLSF